VQPVVVWAVVGALLIVFEASIWIRWVGGPHFVPTAPGADVISAAQQAYFTVLQIALPLLWAICMYYWVLRPWYRERRMTNDGMMAIACWTIVIYDCVMNYTSLSLLYNSHLVNFGSWTTGWFPGWTQPLGNLLPEPIFVSLPGYMCLVFSQVMFCCWLLRRVQARWPHMGSLGALLFIVVGITIIDSVIEIMLIRTGVYVYPGAIRGVSLFAGETYQFPLTEGFFFGGLGVGSLAALKHFKDDRGYTLVERGVERLGLSVARQTLLRFLAIFGFFHAAFLLLYGVPSQWLATHSDPFPQGYPSYLLNGMCVYGANGDQCPGPGVLMPRPANNPF
jgi:hypothetical protein